MKALVTGGAGFIGYRIVSALLAQGVEVVVLDSLRRGNKLDKEDLERIDLRVGDVRDAELVDELARGCDYIYHLAAVLGVDVVADNPVETMEVETRGLRNVAHAAVRHKARKVVYASTSGVYGKSGIESALQEDFRVSPDSSYAISKRYNEIFLKAMHQEKNLNSVSLRYFNVYGPKQDRRMVIPRFLHQARDGEPITVFGTGEQTRDFTFLDDAVEATLLAAEKVHGCEVLNVAYSREYTIKDLAEIIRELTGSQSEITFITPPHGRYDYEVERRYGSSAKLLRLTGYELKTPLREGLQRLLAYDDATGGCA